MRLIELVHLMEDSDLSRKYLHRQFDDECMKILNGWGKPKSNPSWFKIDPMEGRLKE